MIGDRQNGEQSGGDGGRQGATGSDMGRQGPAGAGRGRLGAAGSGWGRLGAAGGGNVLKTIGFKLILAENGQTHNVFDRFLLKSA